jgi:hypothetical protein
MVFMKKLLAALLLVPALTAPAQGSSPQTNNGRWSEKRANDWYARQPWLVGSDYINRGSINQLEMWQADTFNPQQIDQELGWAQSIGMNTMRVFLHDLLWQQDPDGFKNRINVFLTIAAKHHIRPIFVLFDSCWDPDPRLGPQHPPIPGVHNSGWVQSPGRLALEDPSQYPRLKAYVQGIVGAFANDNRVLAWDVWNEPDNTNIPAYQREEPKDKVQMVLRLLPQVFAWAREEKPSQPLTSGLWDGDWSSFARMNPMARIQIDNSDLISFHDYGWPEDFEHSIELLEQFHRPLICTEYMARGAGSTFDTILPIAQKHRVAAINWGFVNGKTQTNFPWDSWTRPYVLEPPTIWFHDIFYPDGHPYRQREIDIIRALTTQSNGAPPS